MRRPRRGGGPTRAATGQPGWPPVVLVPPTAPQAQRVADLLRASTDHLRRTWLPERGLDGSVLPAEPAVRDDRVRACGLAVLALAVLERLPAPARPPVLSAPGDAAPAPATDLLSASLARALARAAVDAHAVTRPGGWGASWQSALWASQLGLGVWLLTDLQAPGAQDGDGTLRADLAAVLVAEADAVAGRRVDVLRDPDGQVLRRGDTASEEVSWDARLLSLAGVLVPGHPRAPAWRAAEVAREAAAFAVPVDLTGPAAAQDLHGWPLAAWLPGSNLEPDGSAINHGIVHPVYMRSPNAAAVVLHAALAGTDVSPAALRGAERLQACLTDRVWPSPPFDPPGGTCYVPGTAAVYRPQGDDWGGDQPVLFWLQDLQAAALGLDRTASLPAEPFADLRLAAVEAAVARGGDGRVYPEAGAFVSGLAEPDAAAKLAEGWLTLVLVAAPDRLPPVDRREVEPPLDGRCPARFTDVAGEEARAAAWQQVAGVLRGTSASTFAPRRRATRGELVVALHRRAGSPAPPGLPPGRPEGDGADEVARAAAWARAQGLLVGRPDGDLDLGGVLRRDALLVVLWREAGRLASPPHPFPDVPLLGEVARAAGWAASRGLVVVRTDGRLDGAAEVDRGVLALVLRRASAVSGS